MNDEIILHGYAGSPFTEKARLMLGFKGLAWRAVTTPPISPKPDLVELTGGYRRAPVLQIGCDVYVDTALIADVLEHLQPAPPLYPPQDRGLARTLAQWADSSLFWAAMAWNLQPAGAQELFAKAPPGTAEAFRADRMAMRDGSMPTVRWQDAAAALRSYLRRLSDMLDGREFLLGGPAPSVADFAAYHPLWYTRRVQAVRGILDATPAVLGWMDRIAGIGHGCSLPMEAAEALDVARRSSPQQRLRDSTFQDDHGLALGSRVEIRAESFGPEPSAGTLVAATRTHLTIERASERAGTVRVHFPRIGYAMRATEDRPRP